MDTNFILDLDPKAPFCLPALKALKFFATLVKKDNPTYAEHLQLLIEEHLLRCSDTLTVNEVRLQQIAKNKLGNPTTVKNLNRRKQFKYLCSSANICSICGSPLIIKDGICMCSNGCDD